MLVGIDPGFSGAIALLEPSTKTLQIFDMPTLKSKSGKTITDLVMLAKYLMPADTSANNISLLEKVGAMPLDGKDRIWSFGKHVGNIEMALVGFQYERHEVTPATWKKHFRLVKDKAASRALAMDRFPKQAGLFSRVKDDGRAEAALIALYGLETLMP